MTIEKLNLLGACTSVAIFVLCSLVFLFRMMNYSKLEYWTGVLFLLTALPLIYLFYEGLQSGRPSLYFIQIGIMLLFILMELILDYIFVHNFREIGWQLIIYVTIFFAGIGGMIGIASHAGKAWMITSVILFFITTALAFAQHYKTGS